VLPESPEEGAVMKIGDYVWTWFDTGAMGAAILYGRVVKAGPKTYTVRWESDLQNRIHQWDRRVKLVEQRDVDEFVAEIFSRKAI
jgi:hypothetical protein